MHLLDYHIHSRHSFDGRQSIDAICDIAVKKGLSEIAITDHFDPSSADENCLKSYNYAEIRKDIEDCRQKYEGKLKILLGLEAGQAEMYPEAVSRILENEYDYVIGSMHNINGDIDLALTEYTPQNSPVFFEEYFQLLLGSAKQGLYDCLGHLDYPKRYAVLYGIRFNYRLYMPYIDDILRAVIQNGKGIEINCSGKRQHINDTLPSFPIIKRYKELGGEIITVGSDAHKLNDVGKKVSYGFYIAREAGFKYIASFEKRTPKFIRI